MKWDSCCFCALNMTDTSTSCVRGGCPSQTEMGTCSCWSQTYQRQIGAYLYNCLFLHTKCPTTPCDVNAKYWCREQTYCMYFIRIRFERIAHRAPRRSCANKFCFMRPVLRTRPLPWLWPKRHLDAASLCMKTHIHWKVRVSQSARRD